MKLDLFLNILTQATFFLLAVATAVNWIRQRDRVHFNIALMFFALAMAMLAQDLRYVFPALAPFLPFVFFLFLSAQPYLLLRIVGIMSTVKPVVRGLAVAGLLVVYGFTFLASSFPIPAVVSVLVYFMTIQTYATLLMVKAARETPGFTSARLKLGGIGSALFVLVFVIAFTLILLALLGIRSPELNEILAPLIQLVALVSGVCYFLCFAPPRWQRHIWQFNEMSRFFRQLSSRTQSTDPDAIFEELAIAARRSIGGMVLLIRKSSDGTQTTIAPGAETGIVIGDIDNDSGLFGSSWKEAKPKVVRVPGDLSQGDAAMLTSLGLRTVLIVPIIAALHPWGLLVVGLKHASLFANDDLDILMILTEQTAQSLENTAMIAQLGAKNRLLEERFSLNAEELSKMSVALVESEKRYRDTLDSMLEGCEIIGFDWKYIYANNSAVMRRSRAAVDFHGRNLSDIYPDIEKTPVFENLRICMEKRIPHLMENEFTYPDGHTAWFELSIQPAPEGIFVLSIDITERKLVEQQLKETIKKLERNNRELQEFAYVASHDLQEPLRKIQTFGDRLKKYTQDLDEKALDYIDRMRSAASRMERLIDDLLSFSRVTTKSNPLIKTDLNEVMRDVIADSKAAIDACEASVEISPLEQVEADPVQIRQVFRHLIGNALKFRQEGRNPHIRVRGEISDHLYFIFVEDNGIGFEEKYLDRIFAPFQRLHGREEYEGTGIGLAIARKIVERHEGGITAKSSPGKGSTFIVMLPITHNTAAAM